MKRLMWIIRVGMSAGSCTPLPHTFKWKIRDAQKDAIISIYLI